MPAEFDPYYTWLGIPPEEQPPHHYRLLGIRPLEADRDVITHAMDQRMAHLRTLQTGKHAEHSQKLLNEVSAAAVVLLDPAKKPTYDASLKQQLAQAAEASAPVAPPPRSVAPPPSIAPPPVADQRPALALPLVVAGAVAGGLAALLLVFVAIGILRMWNTPRQVAAVPPAPAAPDDPSSSTPAVPLAEPEQNPPAISASDASANTPAISTAPAPLPPPAKAADENQPRTGSSRSQPPVPAPATTTPSPPIPAEPPTSPTPTPAPPEPSSTLPPPAEIEAARAKVVEIFGSEARQASMPEQKATLARKMIEVSHEMTSDFAVKYALLDAARRLLAAAGEVDLALATIDELAGEFDEDPHALQLATFSAMSEVPLPASQRDRLGSGLLQLIDRAVAAEEFTVAEEFARLAVKVSSRTSDAGLRRSILQKRSELTRLKDEFQAVQQAREKLAAAEGDPAANLVIGKFLCFAVANFEEGVPHLARSGKEPFAAAARADEAALQGTPEAALQAGDAWFALADSVKMSQKELVPGALVRMRHWYERALPHVSGLDKARLEKRLEETAAITSRQPATSGDPARTGAKKKGKTGNRKTKGKPAK